MPFDFISTLCESKLFPTKQALKRITMKDAADFTYLYFLILIILNSEFRYAPAAVEYARKTKGFGNFKAFRGSATDLYVLLNVLLGDSYDIVATDSASALFGKRLLLKESDVRTFLQAIVSKQLSPSKSNQMMMRIEKQLKITNNQYKAVRRLAVDWGKCTHDQKKLAITRLLQALRIRAPRSELLSVIEALAKDKNLEMKGATNQEVVEPEASKKIKWGRVAGIAAATGLAGYTFGRSLGK